jgi:hypothetical protein
VQHWKAKEVLLTAEDITILAFCHFSRRQKKKALQVNDLQGF